MRSSISITVYLFKNSFYCFGYKINFMSSAFISTPFGGFPKQETLTIAGIFRTGFYEFDQNFVFLNLSDALSIFDKEEHDQNLEIYLFYR